MNNPVNLVSQKQKVRHQQGFASLLFVLLIGLSLVIIVLGVFLSLRGLQDSTITSHAQTQAEEKTTIGVKALSNFLSSKTDTELSVISGGTVKDSTGANVATYKKPTSTCPKSTNTDITQYCFDVTGISSGGASATIRMIYQRASTLTSKTLTGSVFAGGLKVDGNAKLIGDTAANPVEIQIGGNHAGQIVNNSGTDISGTFAGIVVKTYVPTTFPTADSLKKDANYIFQVDSTGNMTCQQNNLYIGSGSTQRTITALEPCTSTYNGISYSNGLWTINPYQNLPVGVLWFDKDVQINLQSNATLVNSIISAGSIKATSRNNNVNTQGNPAVFNSYAPYQYYNPNDTTTSAKVCGTTTIGIPKQYCNKDGTFDSNAVTNYPGNLANILFLTNNILTLEAKDTKDILNFYGNMIASYGNGGTGSASGQFTGTGDINITGNLVMSGVTDTTTMLGNITIDLSKSSVAGSNVIPGYTYANSLRFIKYM
ncbi:hypothetical protein [Acinetobacter sp. ANC 4640]